MSAISITKLYDRLSVQMGKDAAECLTSFVEEKINHTFADKMEVLATKKDLSDLRADLRTEMLGIRAELIGIIGNTKAELIKWMFIFWAGQVITTFGFILLFLKK